MSEERLQEIKDSLTEELNSIDYYGSETAKEGLELYNEVIRLQKNNEEMQIEMARTWKIADDYKTRIDKAIEYINNLSKEPNVFGHYGIHNDCAKWLLKLLRGEDK